MSLYTSSSGNYYTYSLRNRGESCKGSSLRHLRFLPTSIIQLNKCFDHILIIFRFYKWCEDFIYSYSTYMMMLVDGRKRKVSQSKSTHTLFSLSFFSWFSSFPGYWSSLSSKPEWISSPHSIILYSFPFLRPERILHFILISSSIYVLVSHTCGVNVLLRECTSCIHTDNLLGA